MTNRIAAVLVLLIAAGLAYDVLRNDAAGVLFLARKLMDLIEYLAFWR
ncbi:MAG: hypothetical protein U5K36_06790 [Roseovarius sp.]|nr:hypothetical protein [Roseovarius sp.]